VNYFTPKTWMIILLGLAGVSVGAVIFFWGTSSTSESQAFVTSPEFITWFLVNEALFAFYPILAVILWGPLTQLKKYVRPNILAILASSVMLLLLFIFPQFAGTVLVQLEPLPLEYADTKMLFLMLIGFFAAALPLCIGIWLTQAAIDDAFPKAKQTERVINDYIRLRDYLQQFLVILGALLSVFTLTSAALRSVALASRATVESRYPPVFLLILGAYYTLLIAIVYFPAYRSLVSFGLRLLDIYFPLPSPGSNDWAETYSKRKQLEELLELKQMGAQRFITSITVLGPFVSSIFALLIGS
jgi:hypothetical protein